MNDFRSLFHSTISCLTSRFLHLNITATSNKFRGIFFCIKKALTVRLGFNISYLNQSIISLNIKAIFTLTLE